MFLSIVYANLTLNWNYLKCRYSIAGAYEERTWSVVEIYKYNKRGSIIQLNSCKKNQKIIYSLKIFLFKIFDYESKFKGLFHKDHFFRINKFIFNIEPVDVYTTCKVGCIKIYFMRTCRHISIN